MTFEYQQLSNQERVSQINSCIRGLERQHLEIKLHTEAPDLNNTPYDHHIVSMNAIEQKIHKIQTMADNVTNKEDHSAKEPKS